MNKRFKVLLIMCFLMLGMLVPVKTEAAVASKLKISGQTYPTSLKVGAYFILKGNITSNYNITRVTAGIYNTSGKKSYYNCTVNPKAKKYSLSVRADYMLKFDDLKQGSYLYKVTAKDSSGKSRTLVKKTFKVVSQKSTLKITNPAPSSNVTLKKGGTYSVKGKITSNYKITQVSAKLVDASGKTKFSATDNPKKTSYQIGSKIDNEMAFNILSTGNYTYTVTAKDDSGTSKTLVKKTLAVKSTTTGNGNASGGNNGNNGNSGNGGNTTNGRFTVRTTPPPRSNASYYSGTFNIYYNFDYLAPTGKKTGGQYNRGNCTWYAAGRAREIMLDAGVSAKMGIFGPDPVGIWNANKSSKTYAYGSKPKIGSLVIFNYGSNGDAHIAVVESIVNGVPYVSESGYSMSKTKPTADNISFHYGNMHEWGGGRQILGYIYLI